VTNTLFEVKANQLFDVAQRLAAAFDRAGIPYRVVGGFATYLIMDSVAPLEARLTRDIDVAVNRQDLERIAEAVGPFGFAYRHVAGVDMLVDAEASSARTAGRLIFVGEKVRREYVETVPDFSDAVEIKGLLLAPVADLVRMKLTSFRLKDKVNIQDMDRAGLITPDIEAKLSPVLRERLAEVRATE
jgi:hypothetical protein